MYQIFLIIQFLRICGYKICSGDYNSLGIVNRTLCSCGYIRLGIVNRKVDIYNYIFYKSETWTWLYNFTIPKGIDWIADVAMIVNLKEL